MKYSYITGGRVYIGRRFERKSIDLRGGKIRLLPPDALLPAEECFDAGGRRIVP